MRSSNLLSSSTLSALVLTCIATAAPAAPPAAGLSWEQSDHAVALLKNGKVIWRHNHDPSAGKPYIHPLATVDGEVLTWLRPKDHPWHRALWFSWKFINGLNYWEENRKTGLSQGRTEIADITVHANDDFSARIELTLSYHPPGKPAVMSEKRVIAVTAPAGDGGYRLDWTATFTAAGGDVLLDRTPLPGEKQGKSYGGYAGLSVRMAKETRGWTFTSGAGTVGKAIHGKQAQWADASGKTPAGKHAGVTVIDHHANLRYPNAWYVAGHMPYFSPAVLFNKPYTLTGGKSITLRYRVIVHAGPLDAKMIEKECKNFLVMKRQLPYPADMTDRRVQHGQAVTYAGLPDEGLQVLCLNRIVPVEGQFPRRDR